MFSLINFVLTATIYCFIRWKEFFFPSKKKKNLIDMYPLHNPYIPFGERSIANSAAALLDIFSNKRQKKRNSTLRYDARTRAHVNLEIKIAPAGYVFVLTVLTCPPPVCRIFGAHKLSGAEPRASARHIRYTYSARSRAFSNLRAAL